MARRASQPVSRDDFLREYGGPAGVTLGDLVTALVLCRTVEENRRVAFVASVVHGFIDVHSMRRPAEPGRQARYDFEVELLRRRRALVAAERTPEEIEAAAVQREVDAQRDAQALAARKKSDARDRAVDRRNKGVYQPPWERELADSA
ncbi:hypothetical protein [Nocardioides aquiterrae]